MSIDQTEREDAVGRLLARRDGQRHVHGRRAQQPRLLDRQRQGDGRTIKKGNAVEATVSLAARSELQHRRRRHARGSDGQHAARLRSGEPADARRRRGRRGQVADGGVLPAPARRPARSTARRRTARRRATSASPGGTGAPGTACNTNADCQPGTQCFNYTSTGCAREAVPPLLQHQRGLRRVRRGRRRARQLLRGPGHVPDVPDRVPHLHVQLRPARDGRGRHAAAARRASPA